MILSNNRSPARVERFCRDLGITYEGHAGKPSPRGFCRAMARCGAAREETAMLGDKLLTDMLGANRMHFYTILTKPLVSRDLNCTKVNRVFEQMVFRVLERQGKIKRGEYDDKIL